ncbi:hypothetical protein CMV_018914 [Castanea mollissima]|uniref:Uncharacterized protein n=1 Tax=Castanea mollissima TaxID=60419 RepID=A0A8J4QZX4_9ROSI|nr:hypothetical protein CMV_018914 [Castanea mollissima]
MAYPNQPIPLHTNNQTSLPILTQRPPGFSPRSLNLRWTWIEGAGPFITNDEWREIECLNSDKESDSVTALMFNLDNLNKEHLEVVGSRTYHLKNKLSNVRKDLIRWNKQVFGKVENDIWLKQAQLQSIQNSIHTVDNVRKEKLFREELETLIRREEVMWTQKARCNWVVLGDRNTRYFQTMVKQRRARSKILQLKTDDGEVIED